MNNKKDIVENCMYYFHNGYSCSESTLMAGLDYQGVESDCAPGVASVFGGGLKGLGHVCGAVSGTLMLIGILYGKKGLNDTCDKANQLATEFLDFCETELGTIMCRDITQLDFRVEPYPSEKCDKIIEANCVPYLTKICLWQKEHLR